MISDLNSPRKLFHPDNFEELQCQNGFDDMAEFSDKFEKKLNTSSFRLNETTEYTDLKRKSDTFLSFFEQVQFLWDLGELNEADVNSSNVDEACYGLLSPFRRGLPEFLTILAMLGETYAQMGANTAVSSFRHLNLLNSKHSYNPKGFSSLVESINYTALRGQVELEVVYCGKTVLWRNRPRLCLSMNF